MQVDSISGALEELEHDECLKLVASLSIGRIAVTVEDFDAPLVVPVNYVLDGDVVVFRTGPGAKLHALRDTPVSFQVDLIDPLHRTGWSVLVRGIASEATGKEVEHLVVEPWAPGDKHHWIRVLPTAITGRKIRLPDVPWDTRGYR
jgi:nitroimidazol reductase NimA-like FMN-containing flavoprotein (pyridoxamine 5'-phosphate oxidase superfamily)